MSSGKSFHGATHTSLERSSWEEEREAGSARTSTGSLPALTNWCWNQHCQMFWSHFSRLPPEVTTVFYHCGGGGGQRLKPTARSSHPITVTRFQLSLLWYHFSCPVMYYPDPVTDPQSIFPKHHLSSLIHSLVNVCPFSTLPFVPLSPHWHHFNYQSSISMTVNKESFIPLVLQSPIITYIDFSTDSHSFTISYFEQFVKHNSSIHTSQY